MKRISVLATALALGGAAVLAPGTASADPIISVTSNGSPVVDGGVGVYNQAISIDIEGCVTDAGDPAYIGYFLTWLDGGQGEQFESITGAGGSLHLDAQIGLNDTDKQLELNWYCAEGPLDGESEPAVLYLSPTFAYTVAAAPTEARALRSTSSLRTATASAALKPTRSAVAKARKAAPRRKVGVARRTSAAANVKALRNLGATTEPVGAVSMTVDPNALPQIDRMGIHGAEAAALKVKADAREVLNVKAKNLLAALQHKPQAPATNSDTVTAAFQTLTGRSPSAAAARPFIDRLDAGDLKVSVVEDIALTVHTAGYYNR
ncbi:hypothetical protein KSP35_04765 [Aquihabitans sp. G128]|uniref:hypothetical protein n=1 Tax=Aquihabitans sp. G128 TaxID=2849779 RepID=UPI001C23BA68|nr:hypothetical protein [Aquihabitans sp. G128]QXC62125.1 hypothetical protein KSP35_04765 [Aquihabitans sp. G128]